MFNSTSFPFSESFLYQSSLLEGNFPSTLNSSPVNVLILILFLYCSRNIFVIIGIRLAFVKWISCIVFTVVRIVLKSNGRGHWGRYTIYLQLYPTFITKDIMYCFIYLNTIRRSVNVFVFLTFNTSRETSSNIWIPEQFILFLRSKDDYRIIDIIV